MHKRCSVIILYFKHKAIKIVISVRNRKIRPSEWDSFILFLFGTTCFSDFIYYIGADGHLYSAVAQDANVVLICGRFGSKRRYLSPLAVVSWHSVTPKSFPCRYCGICSNRLAADTVVLLKGHTFNLHSSPLTAKVSLSEILKHT